MKIYLVQWSIDIEAESPREAAEKAREIQLDPDSTATVFDIMEKHAWCGWPSTIDLEESIEEQ